ncbi:Uncharacterised protein [Mycobacteroides abscessus subsp. abscessus]|nr:Uncharacterised protein [Mycobacteroides abscessus subsp. abscessus]
MQPMSAKIQETAKLHTMTRTTDAMTPRASGRQPMIRPITTVMMLAMR